MIQFAQPAFLLLILAVPLLLWLRLRRRGPAVRFPAAGLLAGLPSGRARVAAWGGAALRGAALLSLAVALAGPRWPDPGSRIETEGIAMVLIVDISKSMSETDFDWQGQAVSRLEAVKRVVHLFVQGGAGPSATADGADAAEFHGRPTDLIGLITFGHRPETIYPLTLSHTALLHQLDAAEPLTTPTQSETNLSDPVAVALKRLRDAGPRRKVVVLLTDGEHNVDPTVSGWSPLQAAHVAAGLGVPLYTLDAGKPIGGDPSADGRADAIQSLEAMARISHGRYFRTRDTRGLLEAWQAIDRLERSDIQSFLYRRYHEAFPWFGLASFVFFASALALERTWWRRIP
jgi:Ca-activated chloride channel family protein